MPSLRVEMLGPRSLVASHPDLALQWHPTANGGLIPEHVTPGSGRQVWWRCAKDPSHEWNARVSHRTVKGSGCPYCSGRRATPERTLARLPPRLAAESDPPRHGDPNAQLVR